MLKKRRVVDLWRGVEFFSGRINGMTKHGSGTIQCLSWNNEWVNMAEKNCIII